MKTSGVLGAVAATASVLLAFALANLISVPSLGAQDSPAGGEGKPQEGDKPASGPEVKPPIFPPEVFTDLAALEKLVYGDQAVFGDMFERAFASKRDSDVLDALKLSRLLLRSRELATVQKLLKSKSEAIAAAAGLYVLHFGDAKASAEVFARWKKVKDDDLAGIAAWNEAMSQAPCNFETLSQFLKLAKAEEKKNTPGVALAAVRRMLGKPAADCKELEASAKDPAFLKALKLRLEADPVDPKATFVMPAFMPLFGEETFPVTGTCFELTEEKTFKTLFTKVASRKESEGLDITFRILIENETDEISLFSEHDSVKGKGSSEVVFVNGKGRCLEKPQEERKAPIVGKWITVRYAWTPKSLPNGRNNLHTFDGIGPDGTGRGYFLNVGDQPPLLQFRGEKGRTFVSIGSVKTIENLP